MIFINIFAASQVCNSTCPEKVSWLSLTRRAPRWASALSPASDSCTSQGGQRLTPAARTAPPPVSHFLAPLCSNFAGVRSNLRHTAHTARFACARTRDINPLRFIAVQRAIR